MKALFLLTSLTIMTLACNNSSGDSVEKADSANTAKRDTNSATNGKAAIEAYIDLMVDDHKEDIKEFEEAAGKITDTEVKQFINNTLPVLRRHPDSCSLIQQALKK